MRVVSTILPVVVALATASSALAAPHVVPLRPIDDFEAGPFGIAPQAWGFFDVPIPGHAGHAITSVRRIGLGAGDSMGLSTSSPLNNFAVLSNGGATLNRVRYWWNEPIDLTAGGVVDRLQMRLDGPSGTLVTCMVLTEFGGHGEPRAISTQGVESLFWPLSLWEGDELEAWGLEFFFNEGGYDLYDIRLLARNSGTVQITRDFVATQVPPVPSPPLTFRTFDDDVGQARYATSIAIADARTDGNTTPSLQGSLTEIAALGGEAALVSIDWTEPGGIEPTNFELSFELTAVAESFPEVYPPDPAHSEQSVALPFVVGARDGGGVLQGMSNVWLTLDVPPEQGESLAFQDVVVTPRGAAAGGTTTGFTVSFRLDFGCCGSPDEVFPLLTASWTSDWTPQSTTGVIAPVPPAPALRLTARPTVTRAGTELRASRPFTDGASIRIVDALGRSVRRLDARPGDLGVHWDGRTEAGALAAAGVYFATSAGVPGGVRIVRTR